MSRLVQARIGLAVGASAAALFFVSDFAGELLAISFFLDPRLETFYLVGIAGATTVVAGALVGFAGGLAWPRAWRLRLRRRWLVALAALFCIVVTTLGYATRTGRGLPDPEPPPPVQAERPLPVLWVVIDTLRADSLYGENYGFPLAPGLGAWAKRSLLFTDVESGAGWTIPSISTLMTSLHPTTLPMKHLLPGWAPTAAERLRAAGYETHAVVDNPAMEKRNGYAAGFDTWFQKNGLRFAWSLAGLRLLGARVRRLLREQWPVFYLGADRLTEEALSRVGQARNAPLFLYVHYMDPHYPYYPHGPDPEGTEPIRLPWQALRDNQGNLPPAQLAFLRHRYRAEVQFVDAHVSRLLAAWDETYGSESIVMVTSDHGEEFMDHGWLGHGFSLYPELVHVPLMLKLPPSVLAADQQGRRLADPVGQVDLLPTLLEVLGISPELAADGMAMQGHSWLPWLLGKAPPPRRPLVSKHDFRGKHIVRWRQDPWVSIYTFRHSDEREWVELFDKRVDYGEKNNLAAGNRERIDALTAALGAFQAATELDTSRQLEAEENLETLRALGYIQ